MKPTIDYMPREPAHPDLVARFRDLVALYEALRERQTEIDKAFDEVAREIGLVVTTTLPVRVDIKGGKITNPRVAIEALSESVFARVAKAVAISDPIPALKDRSAELRFYLLWNQALSLKLRTDWMEPAHFPGSFTTIPPEVMEPAHWFRPGDLKAPVRPEVMEPAHWFRAGFALDVEDRLIISAIDEVYPELRLVERVAGYRLAARSFRIPPEVMEPAHFKPQLRTDKIEALLTELLAELRQRRY
jgi:hypothetical protein